MVVIYVMELGHLLTRSGLKFSSVFFFSFILFSSLSYDRSKASSKASSFIYYLTV